MLKNSSHTPCTMHYTFHCTLYASFTMDIVHSFGISFSYMNKGHYWMRVLRLFLWSGGGFLPYGRMTAKKIFVFCMEGWMILAGFSEVGKVGFNFCRKKKSSFHQKKIHKKTCVNPKQISPKILFWLNNFFLIIYFFHPNFFSLNKHFH